MCGIFGYTGKDSAAPILLEGLRALEYRGYDSSGIAIAGRFAVKAVGPVENLKISGVGDEFSGIAHTRWATHGEPTEINAHPHTDCSNQLWLVHNGIIENYKELKNKLEAEGCLFHSDTDTEALVHLIEYHLKKAPSLEEAVIFSLKEVQGTYGIALSYSKEPEKIIAARKGAPVLIGSGDGAYFIASDLAPVLPHTQNILYLEDGELAIITPQSCRIYDLDYHLLEKKFEEVSWDPTESSKGEHEHFMLKEIMEIPQVIQRALENRLDYKRDLIKLDELLPLNGKLAAAERIVIVGCGSAFYAGLVGEYMIEEYARLPVEVEVGSEFRYRNPIIGSKDILVAVSQSGETADTLEAIREAKKMGATTISIVNAQGSTISRETDVCIYNHAGPEISVASTKAFISQLTVLAMLGIFFGQVRGISFNKKEAIEGLFNLPSTVESLLENREGLKKLAKKYSRYNNFLYVGRKYNLPIAYEGALKLKEISYIHAEGYGAGEMKHGPLAMIDENFPTVAIALKDDVYSKMLSNTQEIRARKGKVIAIATEDNVEDLSRLTKDIFVVPVTLSFLSPIVTAISLQLFAYYMAKERGYNIDKPRNLAKSVTVE